MSIPKVFGGGGQVVCRPGSDNPVLLGPIVLLYGATSLITSMDVRALESPGALRMGWRTATTIADVPDAWETLGTQRTADNVYEEAFDVSAKTSQMFVQPAVFGGVTSGTAAKNAFVRWWATLKGQGFLVARERHVILPGATSSTNQVIVPIGRPWGCAGVTGLMFAVRITGVSGTIKAPSAVWRSFDTGDPDRPGAWSSALTTLADVTANTNANSGSLNITTTDKLMGQAGIKYYVSGTDPAGTIDVIVAAKT